MLGEPTQVTQSRSVPPASLVRENSTYFMCIRPVSLLDRQPPPYASVALPWSHQWCRAPSRVASALGESSVDFWSSPLCTT